MTRCLVNEGDPSFGWSDVQLCKAGLVDVRCTITIHCFMPLVYATLLLSYGGDVETVSELQMIALG